MVQQKVLCKLKLTETSRWVIYFLWLEYEPSGGLCQILVGAHIFSNLL